MVAAENDVPMVVSFTSPSVSVLEWTTLEAAELAALTSVSRLVLRAFTLAPVSSSARNSASPPGAGLTGRKREEWLVTTDGLRAVAVGGQYAGILHNVKQETCMSRKK
jgi:hypothetical protein